MSKKLAFSSHQKVVELFAFMLQLFDIFADVLEYEYDIGNFCRTSARTVCFPALHKFGKIKDIH